MFTTTYEERMLADEIIVTTTEDTARIHPIVEETSAELRIYERDDGSVLSPNPAVHTRSTKPRNAAAVAEKHNPDNYYPRDSYSFVALNGPTIEEGCVSWPLPKIRFFLFGLMTFVFQMVLFGALVCHLDGDVKVGVATGGGHASHQGQRHLGKGGSSDDPGLDVTACQFVSVLAYMVFPNSAQMDMLNAIRLYPWRCCGCCSSNATETTNIDRGVPFGCLRISCILRALQANIAITVFFFNIMSCGDILRIILNHTAVNFISELDEVAFRHARDGVFAPSLAREAKRIALTRLPAYTQRTPKHQWYGLVSVIYSLKLLAVAIVMRMAEEYKPWFVRKSFLGPPRVGVPLLLLVIGHSCAKACWKNRRNQASSSAENGEDNNVDNNNHDAEAYYPSDSTHTRQRTVSWSESLERSYHSY